MKRLSILVLTMALALVLVATPVLADGIDTSVSLSEITVTEGADGVTVGGSVTITSTSEVKGGKKDDLAAYASSNAWYSVAYGELTIGGASNPVSDSNSGGKSAEANASQIFTWLFLLPGDYGTYTVTQGGEADAGYSKKNKEDSDSDSGSNSIVVELTAPPEEPPDEEPPDDGNGEEPPDDGSGEEPPEEEPPVVVVVQQDEPNPWITYGNKFAVLIGSDDSITAADWSGRVLTEDLVETGLLSMKQYRLTIKAGTKVLTPYVNHLIVGWSGTAFTFSSNIKFSQDVVIEQLVGSVWVEVLRFTQT